MNERDKELWVQSQQWDSSDDGRGKLKILESVERFADLIRADEREALEAEDWTAIMREGGLVTWGDAQELGDRVLAAIRARGNT